jgi:cytosine/adenosine deaminase-related metal-dependent hydrolase
LPGGLTVGAPADIVSLDPTRLGPAAADPDAALSLAVFASRASAIDTVWVRGIPRVTAGRHPHAAAARENFNAVVAALL